MSFKTWLNVHYPVSAQRFRNASWVDALRNSIKKWEGLRVEECKKHRVTMDWRTGAVEGDENAYDELLYLDENTCALCQRAHDSKKRRVVGVCEFCPITRYGGAPCANSESAYQRSQDQGTPKPMLAALRACLRRELAKAKTKKRKRK